MVNELFFGKNVDLDLTFKRLGSILGSFSFIDFIILGKRFSASLKSKK